MDPDDTDYYEFKTSKRGNVVVSVVNRSTTLIPGIEAFDSDFSSVGGDSAHTPGANHRYTFPSQANAVYYVQIKPTGYGQPAGDYSMTITEQ
jgi:hypothetical protein